MSYKKIVKFFAIFIYLLDAFVNALWARLIPGGSLPNNILPRSDSRLFPCSDYLK